MGKIYSIASMIMFARQLIAAPVRLVAWANAYIHLFNQQKAAEVLWFLTRDAEDGVWLVGWIAANQGLDVARARAETILNKCRSARIAVVMAQFEMKENPDGVTAAEWIKKAEALECKDVEILLDIKRSMSNVLDEYDKEEIVEQILSRNDLPGDHTRSALFEKARFFLQQGLWKEAEAIADRILYLEENFLAHFIKGSACLGGGDELDGKKHFEKMKRLVPAQTYYFFYVSGMLELGRRAEAMAGLYQGVKSGLKINDLNVPYLGELYRSQEYAAYCRERE